MSVDSLQTTWKANQQRASHLAALVVAALVANLLHDPATGVMHPAASLAIQVGWYAAVVRPAVRCLGRGELFIGRRAISSFSEVEQASIRYGEAMIWRIALAFYVLGAAIALLNEFWLPISRRDVPISDPLAIQMLGMIPLRWLKFLRPAGSRS